MPLSDLAVKRALPGAKIVKLSDGGGLQLWIMPDGAKRWRLAFRFGGAQKTLALGVYPQVGLKDAREGRDAARKVLARGDDPLAVKKATKAAKADEGANTFSAVAAELAEKKAAGQESGGEPPPKLPDTGFLRLSAILAPNGPIPVGRSTWWAGWKDGRYPKPVKLGARITAWRVEDIRAYIEKRE